MIEKKKLKVPDFKFNPRPYRIALLLFLLASGITMIINLISTLLDLYYNFIPLHTAMGNSIPFTD